ncbi:MAG: 2-phosphosulfolactate phosphatase [Dehalococcoidia bacterium]
MRVDLAWLPPAEPPEGVTCVVVDVLRATSSVAVLLARGIPAVYPTASVDEGKALRTALEGSGLRAALCGEQGGLPPPGFDFGNSPSEFARVDLDGWDAVVMATTNGTPALLACTSAPLVLAGAPLNAGATSAACIEAGHDVLIVCAGRSGVRATDDSLAAALIASRLVEAGATPDGNARDALAMLEASPGDLGAALRMTEHGRALVALGFEHDLDFCGRDDAFDSAAALRLEGGPRALPVLRPLHRADER